MINLVALFALAAAGWPLVSMLHHEFVVLPREDRAFLEANPTREEALQYFGPADVELSTGERFPPMGWHPLPERAVTGSGYCFGRFYGVKIYVFFTAEGKLEHFVLATS